MIFHLRRGDAWKPWSTPGVDTLLLDLDGTLFDTFRAHWRAYRAALGELKIAHSIMWKDFVDINIRRNEKFEALIPGIDSRKLYSCKTSYFIRQIERVRPTKGAVRLIGALRKKGGHYAIVTGSRRGSVDALLEQCWPTSAPDAVITHDDVTMPKPSPECYRVAMRKLSKTANQCIAIEDAPSGVASALGAGVPCLVVRSSFFRPDEFPAGVAFLNSLADLRV